MGVRVVDVAQRTVDVVSLWSSLCEFRLWNGIILFLPQLNAVDVRSEGRRRRSMRVGVVDVAQRAVDVVSLWSSLCKYRIVTPHRGAFPVPFCVANHLGEMYTKAAAI